MKSRIRTYSAVSATFAALRPTLNPNRPLNPLANLNLHLTPSPLLYSVNPSNEG